MAGNCLCWNLIRVPWLFRSVIEPALKQAQESYDVPRVTAAPRLRGLPHAAELFSIYAGGKMFPTLPLGCWKPSSREPHGACEGLCCSRHVWQMRMDSPAGLSLRSGHFRAFFIPGSWLLWFESYQSFSSSK